MFPIGIGHAHAFESAIDYTLSAINTLIHMIFQHETFGGAVQRDKFNGFGWTVLDT